LSKYTHSIFGWIYVLFIFPWYTFSQWKLQQKKWWSIYLFRPVPHIFFFGHANPFEFEGWIWIWQTRWFYLERSSFLIEFFVPNMSFLWLIGVCILNQFTILFEQKNSKNVFCWFFFILFFWTKNIFWIFLFKKNSKSLRHK